MMLLQKCKVVGLAILCATATPPLAAQVSDGERAQAYYFEAEAALADGDLKTAQELKAKATNLLGADNAKLLFLEMRIQFRAGNYRAANQAMERFYQHDPGPNLRREIAPYVVKIEAKLEEARLAAAAEAEAEAARLEEQHRREEAEAAERALWSEADREGSQWQAVWEHRMANFGTFISGLVATSDGSLLVLTSVQGPPSIHRINQDGSFRWTYELSDVETSLAGPVAELDDGSILVGFTSRSDKDTFLTRPRLKRISADGDLLSEIDVPSSLDLLLSITLLGDGSYVLAGTKFKGHMGTSDATIAHLARDGSLIREKVIAGPRDESFSRTYMLDDGSLVAIGGSMSKIDGKTDVTSHVMITRFSSDWSIQGAQVIDKYDFHMLSPVRLSDGALFFSGTGINRFGKTDQEDFPFVVEIDADGHTRTEHPPAYGPGTSVLAFEDSGSGILTVVSEAPVGLQPVEKIHAMEGYLMMIERDSTPVWRKKFPDEDVMNVAGVATLPGGDMIVALQVRTDVKNAYEPVLKMLSRRDENFPTSHGPDDLKEDTAS